MTTISNNAVLSATELVYSDVKRKLQEVDQALRDIMLTLAHSGPSPSALYPVTDSERKIYEYLGGASRHHHQPRFDAEALKPALRQLTDKLELKVGAQDDGDTECTLDQFADVLIEEGKRLGQLRNALYSHKLSLWDINPFHDESVVF